MATKRVEIVSPRPVPPYCRMVEVIRLGERIEDDALLLRRDANPGIRHDEVHHTIRAILGVKENLSIQLRLAA